MKIFLEKVIEINERNEICAMQCNDIEYTNILLKIITIKINKGNDVLKACN